MTIRFTVTTLRACYLIGISLVITSWAYGMQNDDNHRLLKKKLYDAVERCDIESALQALQGGACVDGCSRFWSDRTPLHNAVLKNCVPMVRLLLEHDALIEARDEEGGTPFYYAFTERYDDLVKILVAAGADSAVHVKRKKQRPLHVYAEQGCIHMVEFFLTYSDINSKDPEGNTPLHKAVEHDHAGVVELLCNAGANVELRNEKNETPLMVAVRMCRKKSVEILCNAHACIERACTLLNDSTHVRKVTPGELEIWHFLKNTKAQRAQRTCQLFHALQAENVSRVQEIIDAGVDVNAVHQDYNSAYWCTALHEAVTKSLPVIVTLLVSAGARVAAKDKQGRTPLGLASMNGDKKMCLLLIRLGAPCSQSMYTVPCHISYKRPDGFKGVIPTHEFCKKGEYDLVQAMQKSGIDLGRCDIRDKTPLHKAVAHNQSEVIKLLAEADVLHETPSFEKSMLAHAIRKRKLESIEALLEAGASPHQAIIHVESIANKDGVERQILKRLYAEVTPQMQYFKSSKNDPFSRLSSNNFNNNARSIIHGFLRDSFLQSS